MLELRKNNFPIVDESPTARYTYPMTIVKAVLLFTMEILTGYASQIIRSLSFFTRDDCICVG